MRCMCVCDRRLSASRAVAPTIRFDLPIHHQSKDSMNIEGNVREKLTAMANRTNSKVPIIFIFRLSLKLQSLVLVPPGRQRTAFAS